MLRRPLRFALLGCALTAAACGGSGGGAASTSLSGYLSQLPAPATSDEVILVDYADLARASEIAGVKPPDGTSDTAAAVDWAKAVSGITPTKGHAAAALLPQAANMDSSFAEKAATDDVGWAVPEVDSYAERDTPPARVSVLDGRFERGRLAHALHDAGDGVWVAGDPDGKLHVDEATPARPLGEALWLTLDGHRLRVASKKADVRREGDTLADNPALAALAGALDHHHAYSAMLAAGGPLGADALDEVFSTRSERPVPGPRCDGLTGAAVGVADDGKPLILLAVTQADKAKADGNATAIEGALRTGQDPVTARHWSDIVTVDSVKVEDGVVVATLRPAGMSLGGWRSFMLNRAFPPC